MAMNNTVKGNKKAKEPQAQEEQVEGNGYHSWKPFHRLPHHSPGLPSDSLIISTSYNPNPSTISRRHQVNS